MSRTPTTIKILIVLALSLTGCEKESVGDQRDLPISIWNVDHRTINITAANGLSVEYILSDHKGESIGGA